MVVSALHGKEFAMTTPQEQFAELTRRTQETSSSGQQVIADATTAAPTERASAASPPDASGGAMTARHPHEADTGVPNE